jgi:hypothetical protein
LMNTIDREDPLRPSDGLAAVGDALSSTMWPT